MGSDFPVILKEVAGFPVINVHRRSWVQYKRHAGGREPHQPVSKRVCSGTGVGHQATHISAIHGETIHGFVPHKIAAHFEIMRADHPIECVAEGLQVLVLWTIGIATTIRKGGERA